MKKLVNIKLTKPEPKIVRVNMEMVEKEPVKPVVVRMQMVEPKPVEPEMVQVIIGGMTRKEAEAFIKALHQE